MKTVAQFLTVLAIGLLVSTAHAQLGERSAPAEGPAGGGIRGPDGVHNQPRMAPPQGGSAGDSAPPWFPGGFVEALGGSSSERFYGVETADGGAVAVGTTSSFGAGGTNLLLVRFDSCGDILWAKTFGETNATIARFIFKTYDGGYVVGGDTNSLAGTKGLFLVKYDSGGNRLWTKVLLDSTGDLWFQGYAGMEDSNHDLVITGCMFRFFTGLHSLLMTKFDENGNHLRTRNYYGGTLPTLDYNHWGYSIVEKGGGDDDYLVAGRMEDDDGDDFILLLKVEPDLTGQVGWWVGDSDDQACAYSLIRTSDDGFALTGVLAGPGDAFISRRDSNVNPLWQRKLTTGSSEGRSVVQASDGGLVVTGEYSGGGGDVLLVKWLADGSDLDWSRSYGGDDYEIGYSLIGSGRLWIAGTTESWGAGSYDALLIKCLFNGETCLPDKGGPGWGHWSPPEGEHDMDRNPPDIQIWDWPGQETDPTQDPDWNQEFVCDDECEEACCLHNGTCLMLTPDDCQDLDPPGDPQGPGTDCDPNPCPEPVPTLSEWGLIIMTLLLLIAGMVVIARRRSSAATV